MHQNIILVIFALIIGLLAFTYFAYWLPFWGKLTGNTEYEPKIYITQRGEEVKSYGEWKIANYLNWRGINYEYEHEYIRKDGGINKPDFYLPAYDVYIEYYGMCHLDKQYDYHMHLKFETFEDEGVKVINLYRKHITNKTLRQGLEAQFKNLTGQYLPYRKRVAAKSRFQNNAVGI